MFHNFINSFRKLPNHDPENRVVSWHVFRTASEAEDYAEHIRLGEGQRAVGGMDADSVGKLWWVGVEVDDLKLWGHSGAINKHAE